MFTVSSTGFRRICRAIAKAPFISLAVVSTEKQLHYGSVCLLRSYAASLHLVP